MKKLILVISFLGLYGFSFSQSNLVKANASGFALGQISLSYERVVGDYASAMLNFSFTPTTEMGFKDLLISQSNQDESFGMAIYKAIMINGISITPEFRFYTSTEREAPTGFYFAPYFSYTSHSVTGDFFFNDPGEDPVNYVLDGKYTAIGGGISLGYQWVIADFLAIDFQFLPVGIGAGKAELNVNALGYEKVLYDEIKDDINSDYGIIKTELQEISDTQVKLIAKTLVPVLNFGLKIGFAF
jgi:hypothetical protein